MTMYGTQMHGCGAAPHPKFTGTVGKCTYNNSKLHRKEVITVLRSVECASVHKETCGYVIHGCNEGAEGRFSDENN